MKEAPRLFSYIVAWDGGLAPNPYWEHCTLAVCKPQIRVTAREGDWIVGLSPRRLGYVLVYAMRVAEVLTFGEYFNEPGYLAKRPEVNSDDFRKVLGDNIYEPLADGIYKQLLSIHSYPDGSENPEHKQRDLSGRHVLAAEEFYYYGDANRQLPGSLDFLQVRRGHRCRFSPQEIKAFLRYVEKLLPGMNGRPCELEKALVRFLPREWAY